MDTPKTPARLSKRLRFRLAIFTIIGVVLLGFIAWDVYQGFISWWIGLIAIVVGLILGYALGRTLKVRYNEEEEEIVTHMDIVGVIAIIIYILLAILRNQLLGHFLTGNALTSVTMAVAAGVLLGRYFGIDYSVRKLRTQM